MKRYLLLAFILAGLNTGLSGQDRIITLNNDTIVCKIKKVTGSYIHFDVSTQGVTTSGRVPRSGVLSYTVSSPEASVPVYEVVKTRSSGGLRLGLNGGMGYLTSSSKQAEEAMVSLGLTEEKARSYYSDLKTGWYGSADAIWMINQKYGAGLRYKFFNTTATTEGYFYPGDGVNLYYSIFGENIYVNYAGASIFYREPIGEKENWSLYASFSLGMAFYRNESEIFYGNYLITGNTLGLDGSLGLEYRITPVISAGAEFSIFAGQIRKFNLTDGEMNETVELEKDNYENLARAEVSVGIRFYLWRR